MPHADASCPAFIPKVVDFPEGTSYELLQPLTDFRKNQDGTPTESRILFTCRQKRPDLLQQPSDNEFVVKIKVQYVLPPPILVSDFCNAETILRRVPDSNQKPEAGPSTTTSAELKALESFRDTSNTYTPHLVAWKRAVQGPDGLLPGGYLTYTVMTKMSGQNLLDLQYWTLPAEERVEIVREFLSALRFIAFLSAF